MRQGATVPICVAEGDAILARMRVEELIQGLPITLVRGSPQTEVCAIVEDSRVASAGCLFVARAGTESDGSAFIEEAVPQCGLCLSGWVMTSVAMLEENPRRSDAEIRQNLSSLKCRCGTHMSILRAVNRAAKAMA